MITRYRFVLYLSCLAFFMACLSPTDSRSDPADESEEPPAEESLQEINETDYDEVIIH